MFFFSGDICAKSAVKKMDSAPLWEEYSKQRRSQVQSFGTRVLGKSPEQERDFYMEKWEAERGRKSLTLILWPQQDETRMCWPLEGLGVSK